MKISTANRNGHSIVTVEGSLSNEHLSELQQALAALLDRKTSVLLDLSQVSFICSSALSLLLNSTKRAGRENLHLLVYGLSEDIKKLFFITELNRHLRIFDDLQSAENFLTGRP
jgi:anti-anti-sigma factor